MKPIVFLTAEEVIDLHERSLRRFGGTEGLRDRGLLESACFRPQSGYYADAFEQAAALLSSLVQNHAFVDGNKRIAWIAARTFLLVNGIRLRVSADDAESFLLNQVIIGRADVSAVASWLASHRL